MEPIGYGVLITVAGIVAVGLFVGALGGVITGRLRADVFFGAVVTALAHVIAVMLIEKDSSGKIALFGLLPLAVTFVIGLVTTTILDSRYPSRQILVSVIALASALFAGFLYMMLVRMEAIPMLTPDTAWVAAGVFVCLMLWSTYKRLSALRTRK